MLFLIIKNIHQNIQTYFHNKNQQLQLQFTEEDGVFSTTNWYTYKYRWCYGLKYKQRVFIPKTQKIGGKQTQSWNPRQQERISPTLS